MKYLAILLSVVSLASAESRLNRYAVVLSDPPLAAHASSQKDLRTAAAADRKRQIDSAQNRVRGALADRKIHEIGSVQTLLNAVFVMATEEQAAKLRKLPGVQAVQPMRRFKRHLFTALNLMNVPAAWNQVGGAQNAGAGVKIGILDTGIDQAHPAFQDNSLSVPVGFPKCQDAQGDCAFTNKKVIVARSYVQQLSLEFGNDPLDTRPDDFSPRDHVGHGTAMAMAAAGVSNVGPLGTISGVAPKAYLGNYKIFGSPGVNDFTFEDVVMAAMDAAAKDGMDIVTIALGDPVLCGPNGTKEQCGDDVDLYNAVINTAVQAGMTVVLSAGNDGDTGFKLPSLNTIESPGTAPAAITVGATDNSHQFFQSVTTGSRLGSGRFNALFGNGPRPVGPLTAPLRDVSKLGNDGLACTPLAAGALNGAIALILRGNCLLDQKVNIAQRAGAVGAIIYQPDNVNSIAPLVGMQNTGIPAVLVGNQDGVALKNLATTSPDSQVTLDPALVSANDPNTDVVANFSSRGPSIGESAIKPELVAVGTGLYTATQKYDPNGDMYSPSAYTAAQGTSFSAALVSGTAALVKQRNAGFTPAQIKSAVVNTANSQVSDYDANNNRIPARVTAMGAGKLDAGAAVQTNVTVEPSTVSFGVIGTALPTQTITIRNAGTGSLNLSFAVQPRDSDQNARVTVSNANLTIAGGQPGQLTVRLEGKTPLPGSYEGVISVQGGAVPLRIPYLYVVGDGVPYTYVPLGGDGFVRDVGSTVPVKLTFKILDQYGVPVAGVPVRFQSTLGGGRIDLATETTDVLGIGQATRVFVGGQLGDQEFTGQAAGLTIYFDGITRVKPSIAAGGVVNGASNEAGQGLAPGSYITIYGTGLSESTPPLRTPYLPLSLAGSSVGFDVQSKGISVPGHLSYASGGQINVQIPWELQGQSSVAMKVSIGDSSTNLYTLALNDYSPGVFASVDERGVVVDGANAVTRGRPLILYVNGLGPVDNQPASGQPSPTQPLARTRVLPTVTIGGRAAEVLFSGLAPSYVGLYQLNVGVPADAPTGMQPVVITANGISSKVINLPIQ